MTLTEFLEARLAEDEQVANATDGDGEVEWFAEEAGDRHHNLPAVGNHIERWVPSRVLAEVAAKRWLLAEIISELADDPTQEMVNERLRRLAQPYRDHPDFNPDWAVTE